MAKGTDSFMSFAAFVVPAIVVCAWLEGEPALLLILLGVFIVLQLANRMDRRR